ncbi:Bug family tripartite tricarboxylate transporter substrate binding protein [Bradyrhizobium sp. LHD-71]|uniref:Bug family tripartite tricarboxylate transporter substrate binding protein n=1 Tax=Bradyrhizobium sp. LHD-71 TaxID=3072141 RepID=UPI00280D1303|nr:Bug family tripartite tricarboxylate transporter substrate binding protein [Bradyrhizobium sp. LHD-71]MDQ8731048.1 Bug family tripartite tricarboxylate transporter substrate binding protein [Bradyrhizobium sp. LHD-71]
MTAFFTSSAKLALAAWLTLTTAPAISQTSSSTIRIVFPSGAGGSGDTLARLLADRMRSELGQTVVVENRPGGAGRMGLLTVKYAPADGTTLLLTQMAPMTLLPHVHKSLDYDPVKDFAPIAQAASFSFGLAVNVDVPVSTPKELLSWLKQNPDKAMFGGPGSGGLPHFFGLLVGQAAGVEMTHVAYKGTTNVITDVLGGQLPMMVALASDLAPLHKDGKVRVIATTDQQRFSGLPDVPTFKESGIDIVGTGWFGLYAPANTSRVVIDRLNNVVVETLRSPAIREQIAVRGLKPTGTSPEELAAIQRADFGKWGPIIKASGFTLD